MSHRDRRPCRRARAGGHRSDTGRPVPAGRSARPSGSSPGWGRGRAHGPAKSRAWCRARTRGSATRSGEGLAGADHGSGRSGRARGPGPGRNDAGRRLGLQGRRVCRRRRATQEACHVCSLARARPRNSTALARPSGFAVTAVVAVLTALTALAGAATAAARPFILRPAAIHTVASAVPTHGAAAGDVNPYGLAVVKRSTGRLVRGDVLVSNFNNAANQQGTGSSIVQISPSGGRRVFAVVPRPTATPAVGLTTALVELRRGFVVVGSLPAPGGMSSAATAGALTILGPGGRVVRTITAADINGPWDMTAVDGGARAVLFVTNVLNGTVAGWRRRGPPRHGGAHRALGPAPRDTARALQPGHRPRLCRAHRSQCARSSDRPASASGDGGTLYVADSADNRIAAVPHALTRPRARRRWPHRGQWRRAQGSTRPAHRPGWGHRHRQRRQRQDRPDRARRWCCGRAHAGRERRRRSVRARPDPE